MNEFIKSIAVFFDVDTSTMWKSLASGGTSTGVGIYIADISSLQWQVELNLITLFWGAISCILLTVLSLAVQDIYKTVKSKLKRKKIV